MSDARNWHNHPTIRPGQVWVIEQSTTDCLPRFVREAVAAADVVLYTRTLAELLRPALPATVYAEPLAAAAGADAPSLRARQLAADGWAVVQLVEPSVVTRKGAAARASAEFADDDLTAHVF